MLPKVKEQEAGTLEAEKTIQQTISSLNRVSGHPFLFNQTKFLMKKYNKINKLVVVTVYHRNVRLHY